MSAVVTPFARGIMNKMDVFDFLSSNDISGPDVVLDELLPLAHTTVYQNARERTVISERDLTYSYLSIDYEGIIA